MGRSLLELSHVLEHYHAWEVKHDDTFKNVSQIPAEVNDHIDVGSVWAKSQGLTLAQAAHFLIGALFLEMDALLVQAAAVWKETFK